MKLPRVYGMIALVGLLLAACGRTPQECGMQNNPERQKLGLPLIPIGWKAESKGKEDCTWFNPEWEAKRDQRIPMHQSKYVQFKGDIIVLETDVYYGSADYTDGDGTWRERMYLSYYYPGYPEATTPPAPKWSISLYSAETDANGKTKLSVEEADRVLQKWGLDRLRESDPGP